MGMKLRRLGNSALITTDIGPARRVALMQTGKSKFFPLCLLAIILVSTIAILIVVRTMVKLELNQRVGESNDDAGDCGSCKAFRVLGSRDYLTFEERLGEDGCAKLTITCGKEKGTEAIIQPLQWYKDEQDLGVSFLERKGQSNIVKTVECNIDGDYELEENGERGVVNALECIVAHVKEEL